LGAIALNTGGIQIHDGWLRVHGGSGGGPTGLPSMAEVNGFPKTVDPGWQPPAGLIVAHDVLGGVFALNGMEAEKHGRPGNPGGVVYFSPISLTWQGMEMGHSRWLTWLLDGGAATVRKPIPLNQILSMHTASRDQLGLAHPGELGTTGA
jgi:hypothetical protein